MNDKEIIEKLTHVLRQYADDKNWEAHEEYGPYGKYAMYVWHPYRYETGYELAESILSEIEYFNR